MIKRKTTGNKKVRNATKCEFNGIRLDSKLELFCYKALVKEGIEFEYNPQSFCLIDGISGLQNTLHEFTFNSKGEIKDSIGSNIRPITYSPDFVGNNWILETKGISNELFPMRWKLFKRMLILTNSGYKHVFIAHNQNQVLECIEIIKSLQLIKV